MDDRSRTLVGAAGFAAVGSAVYVLAGAYTTGGANLFPQLIAAAMVVCAVGLFAVELFRRKPATAVAGLEGSLDSIAPRMAWIIVLSCLFVIAMPMLGMSTSSFLFIVVGSWTLGLRRPLVLLAAAAAFALIVPWVFVQYLHILPPRDLILGMLSPGRG